METPRAGPQCPARAQLSSLKMMRSGSGARPLPPSNRYHPLNSSQPGWGPQPPTPAPPCSPPTSAGSGAGRDQPDWAATPAPSTFRLSCQTGPSISLGPWVLFGGRDLPSFLTQGMQKGGVPPSANAIIPSPCVASVPPEEPPLWSLLPLHLKHKSAVKPSDALPLLPRPVSPSAQPRTEGAGGMMAVGFRI